MCKFLWSVSLRALWVYLNISDTGYRIVWCFGFLETVHTDFHNRCTKLSFSLALLRILFAKILVSIYCCFVFLMMAILTALKRNLKQFESAFPWWLRTLNTCQVFLLPLLKTAFSLLVHLFMCISLLLEVSILVFCFVRQGLTMYSWLTL